MIEREIDVTTPDGVMKTFIKHPTHGGPHPVVLYLMDAPSIRPALHDMATRLASAGYYVMMPYLFYRGGPFREFGMSDEDMHARRELMGTVTPTNIVPDAEALLAVAADDDAAAGGKIGAVGFCMSGGLTIALGKAMPDRMAAAASIHGAWLVRDSDDSPHLGLEKMNAEAYFAWCDNDDTAPVDTLETMRKAMEAAGVTHTIDFIETAVHGFAPAGPRYDRDASELHWERVHSLLRRNLY
ncbi:MAG: dienelactone hydrolase family protein [Actinomycetota bacterium]|nr:dienelactone hydrolase family protein [Actinomycetota bacterium]